VDDIGQLQEISVALDEDAFETSMKKMAAAGVSGIESVSVGNSKPVHAFGKVGPVCTEQEMVMIANQAAQANDNFEAFG
jgi:hypothetical protein